jgi:hypothetical protein
MTVAFFPGAMKYTNNRKVITNLYLMIQEKTCSLSHVPCSGTFF